MFLIAAEADRPWTLTEQKALETALRANPAKPDETPAARWQKIANMVGTRTSKECLQRYKYLAEQVSNPLPKESELSGIDSAFKHLKKALSLCFFTYRLS